ncbi:hypothetical protein ACFVGN_39120, partial [Streptomyces sp. NPDC057757]|uniref:hypothetical protein n=1 Tax=Streptomyces sp. NPDC057757 TaxID=3346241 RepID=UPI00369C805C
GFGVPRRYYANVGIHHLAADRRVLAPARPASPPHAVHLCDRGTHFTRSPHGCHTRNTFGRSAFGVIVAGQTERAWPA